MLLLYSFQIVGCDLDTVDFFVKYYREFNNMPRKCCTIFNGESCKTNYKATKTKPFEAGTVYRFPENPDDRKRWM